MFCLFDHLTVLRLVEKLCHFAGDAALRLLMLHTAADEIRNLPERETCAVIFRFRLAEDRLSDCAACERSNEMAYLIMTGRFDEAVRLGQEIFDNKLTCIEQPYEASGVLLDAYVNMMLSRSSGTASYMI